MKKLFGLFLLLGSLHAWAQPCKVYGISDSPQRLSCTFPKQSIQLRCQRGNYYLNDSKVDVAFHYEVESGPNPLVFKTADLQLVVVIHSARRKLAQLEIGNTTLNGNCR